MALIECPDCLRKISAAAPVCPGCGRPMASAAETPPVVQPAPTTGVPWAGIALAAAIFCFLVPYFAAVLLVPVAIILSIVAIRKTGGALAAIAMILAILATIAVLAKSAEIASITSSLGQ